ncbi:MAG: VOC family protein [candidate division KSB1 bacterium]|nr:VOC family protein [candidate division KSB1 bacterium]MDQ7063235.1 VOC family protein [candidate division KSB1 bacterium]
MHPQGILETCIYAEDLQAVEAFYRDVIGLQFFSRKPDRHVFFRCGQAMFLIFNPRKTRVSGDPIPPHGALGEGHVAFTIRPEDVDRWRAHLQAHHVEIESEVRWPSGGYSLYVRDPAGNSVELATADTWGTH